MAAAFFSVVDAPAEIILTVLCKREQVRGEPLQSNILRHAVEQSFANTCKLSERIGEHSSVCCFRKCRCGCEVPLLPALGNDYSAECVSVKSRICASHRGIPLRRAALALRDSEIFVRQL